ncbi:MAG: tRNA (N(6)-L-threonylcarbamoyladenosine(37)-C(2))-methylthiotransferase MtaB [Treponema sp.]|nr:tRNA (N(6)-L-threonylcarbamoyladenosine(37)-C(2))-methylthiotransferase MtaB [Treponema sp.]
MAGQLVHFETLGCKLNQVESEGAAARFSAAGFAVSMEPFTAQMDENPAVALCVVNTCTVTAKAEQKARRIIRLLLSKCPNALVVITGCYAQLDRDELLSMDERVCVLGGQQKGFLSQVPSLVLGNGGKGALELKKSLQLFFDEKSKNARPGEISEPFNLSTVSFFNHSRASLKIQDGCNCVCTYCRIRLARGHSVSLDAAEVLRRVKSLEDSGQSEVVITTVNISQYRSKIVGADGAERTVDFCELLKLLLDSTSAIGIRISSLYPEIVDEELARVVSHPRVMPHFHISVQSGSDEILRRMKRPYKIAAVFKACSLLKKAKKNPFLACDIIAGFPGETDADFAETMAMLDECGFTFVHAFPFSPRPGTEAFDMRPKIPNSTVDVRIKQLESFNLRQKGQYIASFVGKELGAVTESVHRAASKIMLREKVIVHAVTENFLHCQIVLPANAPVPKPGTRVTVRIIRGLEKHERTGESEVLAELCASYDS